MSETKHILILANSARAGKHCVAGKLATPLKDGSYDVGNQWIRLSDPRDTQDGAVPYADTLCRPGRASVRPLDIVAVSLQAPCNDPNHPEDWFYDPARPWQYI